MKTDVIGYTEKGGYCVARVRYSDADWTSPVVEIPASGIGSLDRAAQITADNVAAFAAVARATRAWTDGSVRNSVLIGSVNGFRARYGFTEETI